MNTCDILSALLDFPRRQLTVLYVYTYICIRIYEYMNVRIILSALLDPQKCQLPIMYGIYKII